MKRIIRKLFKKLQHWALDTSLEEISNKGENIVIGPNFKVTHPNLVFLGSNIYIGPNAFLSTVGGLSVGSGTVIGPNLVIYTANHNYKEAKSLPYDEIVISKKVEIEDNVWIGGNVILIPGIKIGEGAVVGAGSVVTRDVEPMSVVGGNPIRLLSKRNKENYNKLKNEGRIYMALKAKEKMTAESVS